MPAPFFLVNLLVFGLVSGASDIPAAATVSPDSLDKLLSDQGTPVLLVFFSTDCTVCFDDLLDMTHFIEKRGLPVRVVGISGDPEVDLRTFVEKYSVRIPIVRDERGRIQRRFKVDIIPYRIILWGGKTLYRDDPYQEFDQRSREAKRFLAALPGT
jgi:hypothetical protein